MCKLAEAIQILNQMATGTPETLEMTPLINRLEELGFPATTETRAMATAMDSIRELIIGKTHVS